jgi:allose kinase
LALKSKVETFREAITLTSPDSAVTRPSYIVVDIGGTNLRFGHVDETGRGGALSTVPAHCLLSDPVTVLARQIAGLSTETTPSGIVIGIPGPLDAARRAVIDAPNLSSLHGLPLADELAKASGLPVWLEHDGALLLLGERAAGSAKGADLVLGVFFGTGIGAAFLKGGRPQKGGDFAMQLGHIPVRGDGRACPCGGVDCIEAYASGIVLRDLAQRHGVRIDRLFTDRNASPELDAALTRFVEDQALAIASGMTLFDPDVAVIGGGVIEMADFPVEALFEATRRRLSPMFDPPRKRLVRATLGWQAVLHGALAVVGQRDA